MHTRSLIQILFYVKKKLNFFYVKSPENKDFLEIIEN